MTSNEARVDPVWLSGSVTLLSAAAYVLLTLGLWPLATVEAALAGAFAVLLVAGCVRPLRERPVYRGVLGGAIVTLGFTGLAGQGVGSIWLLVVTIGALVATRAFADRVLANGGRDA